VVHTRRRFDVDARFREGLLERGTEHAVIARVHPVGEPHRQIVVATESDSATNPADNEQWPEVRTQDRDGVGQGVDDFRIAYVNGWDWALRGRVGIRRTGHPASSAARASGLIGSGL